MKYFYVIIILLFFSCSKKNKVQIEFIHLEKNAWQKTEYNNLSIFLENDSAIIQYRDSKDSLVTKNLKINNDEFLNLASYCSELEKIDLEKANITELDGENISIEFGQKGKSFKYSFQNPNSNTTERGLQKFISLCEKIVLISNLKSNVIK